MEFKLFIYKKKLRFSSELLLYLKNSNELFNFFKLLNFVYIEDQLDILLFLPCFGIKPFFVFIFCFLKQLL